MEQKKDKIIAAIIILFIIILSLAILIPKFPLFIVKKTFDNAVKNFVNISGLSQWLVKGILVFALMPLYWALLQVSSLKIRLFNKKKTYKTLGKFIIVAYAGLFFFAMYFLGRGTYFEHSNSDIVKATKFFANTPEGIRFFDTDGYDPKYGIKLQPVTPDIIAKIKKKELGLQPKIIPTDALLNYECFDTITGEPKVWFYTDNKGNYEFYDQPGYHPAYREELKPITKDVIIDFKNIIKQIEDKRIADKRDADIRKENEYKENIKRETLEARNLFIENNINPLFSNSPSITEVAILVTEKEGNKYSPNSLKVKDNIQDILSKGKIKGISNFFKTNFIENGNFENLFQGSSSVTTDLDLFKHVDYIVLGKIILAYSQDPRLGDLITCRLEFNTKIIYAKTGETIATKIISDSGIGIDNDKAAEQAIKRVSDKAVTFILSNTIKLEAT